MDFKTTLQLIILIALFLLVGFVLVVNAKNKKERAEAKRKRLQEIRKTTYEQLEKEVAKREYLSKYSGRRKFMKAPPEHRLHKSTNTNKAIAIINRIIS